MGEEAFPSPGPGLGNPKSRIRGEDVHTVETRHGHRRPGHGHRKPGSQGLRRRSRRRNATPRIGNLGSIGTWSCHLDLHRGSRIQVLRLTCWALKVRSPEFRTRHLSSRPRSNSLPLRVICVFLLALLVHSREPGEQGVNSGERG